MKADLEIPKFLSVHSCLNCMFGVWPASVTTRLLSGLSSWYSELGRKSPWWPYLRSLPQFVDLPFLWAFMQTHDEDTVEALDWGKGTELEKALIRERGETLVQQVLH
jgi:hypothetical protein